MTRREEQGGSRAVPCTTRHDVGQTEPVSRRMSCRAQREMGPKRERGAMNSAGTASPGQNCQQPSCQNKATATATAPGQSPRLSKSTGLSQSRTAHATHTQLQASSPPRPRRRALITASQLRTLCVTVRAIATPKRTQLYTQLRRSSPPRPERHALFVVSRSAQPTLSEIG